MITAVSCWTASLSAGTGLGPPRSFAIGLGAPIAGTLAASAAVSTPQVSSSLDERVVAGECGRGWLAFLRTSAYVIKQNMISRDFYLCFVSVCHDFYGSKQEQQLLQYVLDMKPGFRPSTTLRYLTRPVHRNAKKNPENEGYTEDEYRLTLQGAAYLEDNRKVAHFLQEAIRGHTTAYNHCSDKLQAQLGRQAFMALVANMRGPVT